jgi:hypothetical protein
VRQTHEDLARVDTQPTFTTVRSETQRPRSLLASCQGRTPIYRVGHCPVGLRSKEAPRLSRREIPYTAAYNGPRLAIRACLQTKPKHKGFASDTTATSQARGEREGEAKEAEERETPSSVAASLARPFSPPSSRSTKGEP